MKAGRSRLRGHRTTQAFRPALTTLNDPNRPRGAALPELPGGWHADARSGPPPTRQLLIVLRHFVLAVLLQ
jgi:hypothetical protein